MAKTKIQKQVDAAQKRVQKFIDEAFDDLQKDVMAQFAVAKMNQKMQERK
jgi:hypothetical protein